MAARQGGRIKDHTVLALDIGSRYIKVAELRLARGVVSLLDLAISPTPVGVMDGNQILDPVTLGRAVREMLAINRIKTRKVVTAVSGQTSVVVRPIDLPRMTRKELKDNMKFEVERHVPFTVDEIIMDYTPFIDPDDLPPEESNMKVLLAVAQRDLIHQYIKVLDVAKLRAVALDLPILAEIRSLIDNHQEAGSYKDALALVEIGARGTDISIINQGNLSFTRSVPLGGDALTQAIADQMGRGFDEAEDLKKELGFVYLDSVVGELPPPSEDGFSDFSGKPLFDSPGKSMIITETPRLSESAQAHPLTPQQVFSLEDDLDAAPVMPQFPGSTPLSELAITPPFTPETLGGVGPQAPFAPLQLDSASETVAPFVPIDNPAARFSLDDEEAAPAAPSRFMLDDAPMGAPTDAPAAASLPTAPTEFSAFGPELAFDLSSELQAQLPPPLSRPSMAEAADGAQLQASTPMGGPAPVPQETIFPAAIPSFTSPAEFRFDEDETTAFPLFDLQQNTSAATDFDATTLLTPGVFQPTMAPMDFLPYEQSDVQSNDMFQRRLFEAMQPTLAEIVTEIRRSLEYYSTREPDTPIERIILSGGTTRLPNLAAYIHSELGLEVLYADPLVGLDLSMSRQSPAYLQEVAPALPVCIGLALRDMIA